jgi:hypothetical protein
VAANDAPHRRLESSSGFTLVETSVVLQGPILFAAVGDAVGLIEVTDATVGLP